MLEQGKENLKNTIFWTLLLVQSIFNKKMWQNGKSIMQRKQFGLNYRGKSSMLFYFVKSISCPTNTNLASLGVCAPDFIPIQRDGKSLH